MLGLIISNSKYLIISIQGTSLFPFLTLLSSVPCRMGTMFTQILFAAFLVLLSLHGIVVQVYADELNPGIYSLDSKPFDVSYDEWVARWWNWTAGIPMNQHPRDFEDRPCDVQQSGQVWFLPDTLTGSLERECTVPFGKAIFVPIITGEMSVAEDASLASSPDLESKLSAAARACDNDSNNILVELDGVTLKGFEGKAPPMYRVSTPGLFNITWGQNNIYDIQPTILSPAFAEGWFLFLEPPSVGDHTIKMKGEIVSQADPSCNSHFDSLWQINVQK